MDNIIMICGIGAFLLFFVDFFRYMTGRTKKSDFPILIFLGIFLILVANLLIK